MHQYKYKTELHCHTVTVSGCATEDPAVLLEKYIRAGYSSIVVTDHFEELNTNTLSKTLREKDRIRFLPTGFDMNILDRCDKDEMSWDDKIDFQMAGYRYLKELAGDRINILLGAELRLPFAQNHYLLYGLTEEFLRREVDLTKKFIFDASDIIRQNDILFIQAHPFRNWDSVTRPDVIDGIEVYNGAKRHDYRNDLAEIWAERYHLIPTAGTDFHRIEDLPDAGILTEKPIETTQELVEILRSGHYELIKE